MGNHIKIFNGHNKNRKDVYKNEILISRHYYINDEIQINLIKIATKEDKNISAIVRIALNEYIQKNK